MYKFPSDPEVCTHTTLGEQYSFWCLYCCASCSWGQSFCDDSNESFSSLLFTFEV